MEKKAGVSDGHRLTDCDDDKYMERILSCLQPMSVHFYVSQPSLCLPTTDKYEEYTVMIAKKQRKKEKDNTSPTGK